MVGATMNTDDLLKRVGAIPGVMEASIMHGRQRDRLYVKVASGDANPVNRRVHPLLEQFPGLGLLYEYEQAEPCGAYDAMPRQIPTLPSRSPTGPKNPPYPASKLRRYPRNTNNRTGEQRQGGQVRSETSVKRLHAATHPKRSLTRNPSTAHGFLHRGRVGQTP